MIVVYGSINIDLVGHAPRLMAPGETVLGTSLDIAPGGKGANQALAASRAGADVAMVGCVGNDGFASQALALLSVAEIDLSHVRRMDRHTGTALIIVETSGENMITVLPGANNRLGASALDGVALGQGDTLVLQLESPIQGVVAAAEAGRRAGARVIVNLAPYASVPEALLDAAHVLVANEGELAGTLATLGEPEAAPEAGIVALARRCDALAIVTLGAGGALASDPEGAVTSVVGRPITPLDTTGAGDTFVGYLAAALAADEPLATALARANAAAALACLVHGAQPSIPEAYAVDDALAERA